MSANFLTGLGESSPSIDKNSPGCSFERYWLFTTFDVTFEIASLRLRPRCCDEVVHTDFGDCDATCRHNIRTTEHHRTPPAPSSGRTDAAPTFRTAQVFRDCPECPEMVVIPAGSFTIGSPANEKDRYVDEERFGLSYCHTILERQQGKISFESKVRWELGHRLLKGIWGFSPPAE